VLISLCHLFVHPTVSAPRLQHTDRFGAVMPLALLQRGGGRTTDGQSDGFVEYRSRRRVRGRGDPKTATSPQVRSTRCCAIHWSLTGPSSSGRVVRARRRAVTSTTAMMVTIPIPTFTQSMCHHSPRDERGRSRATPAPSNRCRELSLAMDGRRGALIHVCWATGSVNGDSSTGLYADARGTPGNKTHAGQRIHARSCAAASGDQAPVTNDTGGQCDRWTLRRCDAEVKSTWRLLDSPRGVTCPVGPSMEAS
jgi:hypothetical protein